VTVSLRPAGDADLAAYLERHRDEYITARVQAGDTPEVAARNADEASRQAFPDGRPAGGHVVLRIERDGTPVGTLWIGPQSALAPDRWWVWDIVIDEAFRGQGLGRQAMLLAETEARARGAIELGLNVFGHNHVAAGLYRSLGYEVTAMQMRKAL
jgi:ribosomal protein S18 acetylase RimI-like enzyme